MSTATVTARRVATVISGKELAGDTEFTTIQAAITYAATQTPSATQPWDVYIHPGIYDEVVTCSSWVNLRGIGPKGSVVIQQTDATIITLANDVEHENFTVRLVTPAGNRSLIIDNGATCICRFTNIVLEITTPGGFACQCFLFTGAVSSHYILEACSYDLGNMTGYGIRTLNNNPSVSLINCDFEIASAAATHLAANDSATFRSSKTRFAGTARLLAASNGTFTFDNDAMICTGAWTNTGSTMTLRHCAIEAPVVAGNLATVRLKDCSYRAISRAGTGNIVDESAELKDAPWKVHKWTWQAVLANAQVAVRGTPADGGTGQVLLEVNTAGAADQEAVETDPEAAGSLANEFTPARTPRFITQVAVDNFHADADMFFGLRETLGNAIPDITAEECAGFDWNGANFRAISSDGAGAGVATNLTTPSVDAQHQLEVIVFGGGNVEFYVDGVLVATHTTAAGRPSAVLDWQHLLNNGAGGGGAGDIDVTVRNGGVQECPA